MTKAPFSKIYLFDYVIFGYLVLIDILILLFGRPFELYYDELLINFSFIVFISLIVIFLKNTKNRMTAFFRFLYPAMLFTFLYEQTGGLMKLFFSSFFDNQLTAFEISIFGIEPTLWLDRNLISTWLTEILSFSYFSYYFMLPAILLHLFFKKKYFAVRQLLIAICLAFFVSYLIFFLYPIEGPRYHYAGQYINEISGPIFRPMVEYVIRKGAVHGGCMPSSHVAVALVIMAFALKYLHPLGLILIPINLGLAIATVYGRFHYISDVFAGTAIAITIIILVMKYYPHFDNDHDQITSKKKETMSFVS
jgi:membrane-associated phospholipid phosphatase